MKTIRIILALALVSVLTMSSLAQSQTAAFGENEGNLSVGDTDEWVFKAQAGDELTFTVEADWDTTLTILLDNEQIDFNDDDEELENFNSRLTIEIVETAVYTILVGSFNDSLGGSYALFIEKHEKHQVQQAQSIDHPIVGTWINENLNTDYIAGIKANIFNSSIIQFHDDGVVFAIELPQVFMGVYDGSNESPPDPADTIRDNLLDSDFEIPPDEISGDSVTTMVYNIDGDELYFASTRVNPNPDPPAIPYESPFTATYTLTSQGNRLEIRDKDNNQIYQTFIRSDRNLTSIRDQVFPYLHYPFTNSNDCDDFAPIDHSVIGTWRNAYGTTMQFFDDGYVLTANIEPYIKELANPNFDWSEASIPQQSTIFDRFEIEGNRVYLINGLYKPNGVNFTDMGLVSTNYDLTELRNAVYPYAKYPQCN